MDWKLFLTVFATVFLAELGDKSQMAAFLYAADREVSRYTVFFAAFMALAIATAASVLVGSLLSEVIEPRYLQIAAGLGFIAVGLYTLIGATGP